MLMAVEPDPPAGTITTQEVPWYGNVLTALSAAYQQNEINKINLERAKQGLDPLPASATATSVNVGLPPEQMRQLMLLGGGLLLILAISMLRRR